MELEIHLLLLLHKVLLVEQELSFLVQIVQVVEPVVELHLLELMRQHHMVEEPEVMELQQK